MSRKAFIRMKEENLKVLERCIEKTKNMSLEELEKLEKERVDYKTILFIRKFGILNKARKRLSFSRNIAISVFLYSIIFIIYKYANFSWLFYLHLVNFIISIFVFKYLYKSIKNIDTKIDDLFEDANKEKSNEKN